VISRQSCFPKAPLELSEKSQVQICWSVPCYCSVLERELTDLEISMPPKQASGPSGTDRMSLLEQTSRLRVLYMRLVHPTPPVEPELVDEWHLRSFLNARGWNVDRAERDWRAHTRAIHRERQAAAVPTVHTAPPTQASGAANPANLPESTASEPDSTPYTSSSASDDDDDDNDTNDDEEQPQVRLDPDDLTSLRTSRLPSTRGEQQRRDAALAFKNAVDEEFSMSLAISEAVFLMRLAAWDIGVALAQFDSHESARRRLRSNYDGLRTPPTGVTDKIHQSKCLHVLTEITDRSDWFSLKQALQRVDWNLVQATVEWYKTGIPVFDDRDIRGDRTWKKDWAMRKDRWGRSLTKPDEASTKPPSDNGISGWADEPDDFTYPEGEAVSPKIWGQQWRDDMAERAKAPDQRSRHLRNNRGREEGFLLNFDRSTVKPCKYMADADFRLEYFSKGQYTSKHFFKGFDWDRPDDSSDEHVSSSSPDSSESSDDDPAPGADAVSYDPENKEHVGALNSWRRNTLWTACNQPLGGSAQKWTQEELDFLYQLMVDLLAHYKTEYPRMTRKELLPILEVTKATKDQWEQDFNRRFAGTICGNEQFPRRPRRIGGILQERTRSLRLAIHFRIQLNEAWEKKLSDEEKEAIKEFKRERDEMEADDEQVTMQYNADNPTDDPVEGRTKKKPRTNTKRPRKSSTPPGDGDGTGGAGPGPGPDGAGNDGDGADADSGVAA
jgi:hypothetical protein